MKDSFKYVAMTEENANWNEAIKREKELYNKQDEIRSEFARDYTRIIYSNAYKRMKHKTQVFFSPQNDHICTRIEHVNHVESISYTIANYLGLNTELTKAIAVAHDIGHSPFGHEGERETSKIAERDLGYPIWHEKNGLYFVDDVELLEDHMYNTENLNLTYAVRDGIISHCGEIDQNGIKPRKDAIDLSTYSKPNEYAPYTWEACVVKISDKISYIGRDIQDGLALKLLGKKQLEELDTIVGRDGNEKLNNTVIVHELITDLCKNSTIENGLTLSQKSLEMMDKIKRFNYENIYKTKRKEPSERYFHLVINEIYNTFKQAYNGADTEKELLELEKFYPKAIPAFVEWIQKYWSLTDRTGTGLKNKVLYNMLNEKDYYRAVIDYILGMTDNYAIETYNEIICF